MDDAALIEEWTGLGPNKVLEDAPDAVLVVRRNGTIAFANRFAVTLFGYSRQELTGKSVDTLLPEDRRGSHAEYIASWFRHPRPRPMGSEHLNIQGRNKDGELMNLDIKLSPIETKMGVMAEAWIRERGNNSVQQWKRDDEPN